MRRTFIILLTAIVCCSLSAKTLKKLSTASSGAITLHVDSIEFRHDLTRVYGSLIGRPHTSNRIDKLTLKAGSAIREWTDVDGIDAGRWFQWEDDGRIAVEIDFPPIKSPKSAVLIISAEGPKGNSQWQITPKGRYK